MNKRMKELKIEAWDYACGKIPPGALGQKNHEDYFAEKFAELIVEECAKIAEHSKGIEVDFDMYFKAFLVVEND